MDKSRFIVLCFFVVLLGACGVQEKETSADVRENAVVEGPALPPPTPAAEEQEAAPAPEEAETVSFDLALVGADGGRGDAAEAHAGYLDDDMTFMNLATEWEGDTAVVGSKVARFYPGVRVEKDEDLPALPEGIPLPFAALIPIRERLSNPEGDYYGFFEFEDNYNYFYLTEWEGQQGIVFGADLAGLNASTEKNLLTASMYAGGSRYEEFPPYAGYYPLADNEIDTLEKNRLALQRVRKKEYYLSLERPDDMISLYMNTARDKYTPLFITTDLVSQGLHLFFDQFLQQTEEKIFIPRLGRLTGVFLDRLEESDVTEDADDAYGKAVNTLITYFQVADCLIKLAPEIHIAKEDWGEEKIEYTEPDRDTVLALYPEKVREEVELICNAAGSALSPSFQYEEDYSQYKPRGHYTKNGVLEAYFRTMMWFGRIHFYMSDGQEAVISDDSEAMTQGSAASLSLDTLPMVAVATDIAVKNPDLFQDWKLLFDPITDLIGMSDDLSFYEAMPFFEGLHIEDLRAWTNDVEQVSVAILKAREELRSPLIAGNSVWEAPSGEGRTPPMGWRLFGQRFTWDSYVHQLVSPPRLMSRDIVRGLDIMKAFGSRTADNLLRISDYPEMAGLEETLGKIEEEFEAKDEAFWKESYYNSTLAMIRAQACFEPGAGFYFTESPLWGIKSQISAHGTWAALRHDTILYVKQVYAERAGDGDFNPTFRTEPLPLPVHYIEPNLPFFDAALSAVREIRESGRKYGFIGEDYEEKLASWDKLLARMTDIAYLEYKDEEVAPNDVEWIRTIPQQLVPLVLAPEMNYASYVEDEDILKSAIVADVFTNAEQGVALEVGTGIPYRLLVALNDGQGRKRIAVGFTFSYFEFLVGQSERMTNEEWREIVYPGDENMDEYLPFWSKGLMLEARP